MGRHSGADRRRWNVSDVSRQSQSSHSWSKSHTSRWIQLWPTTLRRSSSAAEAVFARSMWSGPQNYRSTQIFNFNSSKRLINWPVAFQGDFKWMRRSRIRITMLGQNGDLSSATDMHDSTDTLFAELPPDPLLAADAKKYNSKMKKLLPYMALNEVWTKRCCIYAHISEYISGFGLR